MIALTVLHAALAAEPAAHDLDGRRLSLTSGRVSVLLFTRADCPISNRYAPEISRLYKQFQASGVAFRLVYVGAEHSTTAIRAHAREYGYPFPAVIDSRHRLARWAGVKTTPEVAVFASGRLVYRGRIDNRYASVGVVRRAATVHDLEDTLAKAVLGQPLEFRTTPAIGCLIEDLR